MKLEVFFKPKPSEYVSVVLFGFRLFEFWIHENYEDKKTIVLTLMGVKFQLSWGGK